MSRSSYEQSRRIRSNRYSHTAFAEVLRTIQSEWGFMAQDKCVPVQVALQLMDASSLGRAHQYGEFQYTHKQLQRALKAIVNEHHQGFNSSIGTFHKIQSSIQASQHRLRGLKGSLDQAKIGLSTTRPELKGLAATSHSYDEMLHALNQIEQLRLVTDKLEARISEKRFLTAVDILQDALKMLRKPELDNIGALSDLRIYLANQETSLTDILIEELHSHLYLKSPYCQDRWKAHAKEQSNGASLEGKGDGLGPAVQPLYQFLDDLNLGIPMVEDAARNPEADSFYYFQLLVESLNKMDRLDVAVNAIEQRLPVELFRVVDKTNSEVDQRHPTSLRGNTKNSKGKIELDIGESDIRAVVVYDLLWTLYAKFEAIAEGHRVFHDVVSAIAKRENIRNPETLTGSFKELWMLYQNEIRSLLHDYLATDSNMYRMSQSVDPNADIFRRGQRKKDKKMFSLSDTDPKSVEMTTEFDDLESILKASVPGLVSDPTGVAGGATDDKNQQTDGAATGHKLLIEPSVFNMGLLLPPSLAFLQRLKDIVPPRPDIKTSTLTSFLDDFLVNVFLPQLDETLVKLSSQVFEESDAFQEDPLWTQVARRPIFRGSSAFFNLITAFCRMLDTLPHDQAFSQLIITQMVTYYDRCCDWYKALVSHTQDSSSYDSTLKASATFASGPGEIHDTIRNLWTEEEPDPELLDKEVGLLILQTNEAPLQLKSVIQDRKTISSLCLLYTSLKWLANNIEQLRHITTHDADSSRRNTMRVSHNRRWTLLNDPSKVGDSKPPVYLPMTQETVV
jgi:exocyst complex component 4